MDNSLSSNKRFNESGILTKKEILHIVKQMPDTFEPEQFFTKIILLSKIKEGRQNIKKGEFYTPGQAKTKMKKWLK